MILLLECGIIQARSGSGQKFAGASHQNCGCAHCLVRWLSSLSGLIPTICREGVETETISRSHSPHGECGFQLYIIHFTLLMICSHSPHGECGFQQGIVDMLQLGYRSLSARGVWISTCNKSLNETRLWRHSPHGECGFQLASTWTLIVHLSHSPHGE